MSDQPPREIQLTGKQLIFLFMSAVVLLVAVFLLGVSVGRGVGSPTVTASTTTGQPSPGDTSVPTDAPASADDPVTLSYPAELTGRGSTPPPPAPPNDEMPPITPPGATRGEVTEQVPDTPAPPPVPETGEVWWVQVGAYRSRASADKVLADVTGKGHKALISPADGLNRVRVGPFPNRDAADLAAASLKSPQYPSPRIVKEGQ